MDFEDFAERRRKPRPIPMSETGTALVIRPAASARWLALAGVALIATTVMLLPLGGARTADRTHRADSYTRLVNDYLVPMGWLVRVDDPATGIPQVRLSREAQRTRAVTEFMNSSYLGGDLAANDPALWSFDGGSVRGIQVNAHNLTDPLTRASGWQHNLLFRTRSVAMPQLVGPAGTFTLGNAVDDGTEPMISLDDDTIKGSGRRQVAFYRGNGERVASVRLIGNKAVLRISCAAGRARDVMVTAAAFPAQRCTGESADDYIDYPLGDQDRVEFRQRAAANGVIVYRVAQGQQALSWHRPFGARLMGSVANDLSSDIAASLDALVARPEGQGYDRDLPLTLDRSIQTATETILHRYAEALRRSLGRPDRRYFPAAVTIMDASGGDLLALASYPRRADLERSWDASNSYLSRNQNFVALPIGSAAKVPVSAAILTRFPSLADLCLPAAEADAAGQARFHTILGARLPAPIGDTVAGGTVDFDRFLARSSNRFAAGLAMLAAAKTDQHGRVQLRSASLDPRDRFVFGACSTNMIANVPNFVFARQHGRIPWADDLNVPRGEAFGMPGSLLGALNEAQGRPNWIETMERLFNLTGVADSTGVASFDPAIWSGLLGDIDGSAAQAVGPGGYRELRDRVQHFASVSPDRMRFDLGAGSDLRNGYLMTILGGGGSRWTAIKLAESYARIVLQRPVAATLVPGAGIGPATPGRGDAVGATAHATLTRGMKLVAGGGGTASELSRALAAIPVRNGELRAYAKTGTPILRDPARSRRNRLLDTLIRTGVVSLDSYRGLIIRGRHAGESVHAAIHRLGTDRRLRLQTGDPEWMDGTIATINRAWRNGDDSPLIFDRTSALVGVRENSSERLGANEAPEGGVIAAVIGRYCKGSPANQPLRAISVVINVQARTVKLVDGKQRSGPNPALEVTQSLLAPGGALARWLSSAQVGEAACPN